MPSHTDTAGHTEAFDYPVAGHWGETKNVDNPEMFSSAGVTRGCD